MRAIVWDFDGTIADTSEQHYRAWELTLAEHGIGYEYEDFIYDFGRSNQEIIPRYLPDYSPSKIEVVSLNKEAMYRTLLAETEDLRPLPGVCEWLEEFLDAHIRQAIASSGPMSNIAASVHALGIGNFFHSLLSGYHLPRGKPDPTIFLNAAASLQASPAETIVIEDSMAGVEAARRAGMTCIVVGEHAYSQDLADVLARAPGRTCLQVGNLEMLVWEEIERLWAE